MQTAIKTAPATKPVSLSEIKEQLEIVQGQTHHDSKLRRMIGSAVSHVESILRRRLITQTWYAYLDDWYCDDYRFFNGGFVLPFGQLQSVTAITYTDEDGDESTWSASEYIVDTVSDPGRVVLGYDESFPTTTLYPSNPIKVEYVCGYGDDRSDIPEAIRHAIILHVSDQFQNREPVIIGTIVAERPVIRDLLLPHILYGG